MVSDLGPINFMLQASHIAAKVAFSDKNPKPGCIALLLVATAALNILVEFR